MQIGLGAYIVHQLLVVVEVHPLWLEHGFLWCIMDIMGNILNIKSFKENAGKIFKA